MARRLYSSLEPLESRIAPAAILHPLANLIASINPLHPSQVPTGTTIDLGNMLAQNGSYDTLVTFHTNFDTDPNTPGIQGGDIVIELFDTKAPLAVQNFLDYVTDTNGYATSFFSRLAFNQIDQNTSVPFVLQGGGFSATADSKGVITKVTPISDGLLPIHNEYDASDSSRSNTEGTIAMAKIPTGPNTATDEFFFNLGDNSQNLNNQNGGFTVFGKVTAASLDVLKKIDTLPVTSNLQKLNGALTNVPYMGTLASSNAAPTVDQLVRITGVDVQTATLGQTPTDQDGHPLYTYAVTSDHPELVSTTLSGTNLDQLNLAYHTGGAGGVAHITVQVNDQNGQPVNDDQGHPLTNTFSVSVLPNLIANSVSDTLPTLPTLVPQGTSGNVTFKVMNEGVVNVNSVATINVYLAPIGADGTVNFDASNPGIPLGSFTESLNLAPGGSQQFTHTVKVPKDYFTSGAYEVVENVTIAQQELFTDDSNTGGSAFSNGAARGWNNIFGNFAQSTDNHGTPNNLRVNVPFTYTDSHGDLVTLTYKGDGAGVVIKNPDNTFSIETGYLGVTGNSSTSSLSVKITDASGHKLPSSTHTSIEDLTILNPIGKISLGNVDITGNVDLVAGAKSVTLGDLKGDGTNTSSFTIGASALLPAISVGNVTDYNLTALSDLKSLTATNWKSANDTQESLVMTGLGSLQITGELDSSLTVNANSGSSSSSIPASATAAMKTFSVGSLNGSTVLVAGSIGSVVLGSATESTFTVGASGGGNPDVRSFTVLGKLDHTIVQLAGDARTVTVGSMDTSNFLVGVTGSAIPDQRSDFSSIQTIGTFTLKNGSMKDSHVAAANFGRITATGVDASDAMAFVAETIARYQDGQTVVSKPEPGSYDGDRLEILPFS